MWNVMIDSWLRVGRWVHEWEVGSAASVSYKGRKKRQLVQHHEKVIKTWKSIIRTADVTPTTSAAPCSQPEHTQKDIFLPVPPPSPPGQWWCTRLYWRKETPTSSEQWRWHSDRSWSGRATPASAGKQKRSLMTSSATEQISWHPADTIFCLTSRLMMRSGWSRHSMMVIWCWRASLGSCWTT